MFNQRSDRSGRQGFNGGVVYGLSYLQPQWVQSEAEAGQTGPHVSTIVIFASRDRPLPHLEEAAKDRKIIAVYPGSRYNDLGGGQYEIHPQRPEELEMLWDNLQSGGLFPGHLIHLWAMDNGTTGSAANPIAMEESLDRGAYSVLGLLQCLIRRKERRLSRMIVCYPAQEEGPDPLHDMIGSVGHSLGYVWPELSFSTVQVDGEHYRADCLLRELEQVSHDREVLLTERGRYVKRPVPVNLSGDNGTMLRKGATYVITGGTGALGLLFARHLTQSRQCNVVLLGRSAPGPAQREAITEMERSGARVLCLQADVADREQMERAILQAKEAFGPIGGVIHAAGLMSDKLFHEKSVEDAKTTMRAKIHGTAVLDEVTKDEPLELFALFSSAASVLGDFGQCDYALGNRFMDGYGRYRNGLKVQGARRGRTVTVNWPLWADGGMHQDLEAERLYLAVSGMGYLQNGDGLRAFEEIVASGLNQVLVLFGDGNRYGKEWAPMTNNRTDMPSAEERADIREQLEEDLKEIAAQLLKIGADQMESGVNIGEYGFDSISLKSFADEIGRRFGIETSPTLFFSSNTIGRLAGHLLSEHRDRIDVRYMRADKAGTANGADRAAEPQAVRPRTGLVPLRHRLAKANSAVPAGLNPVSGPVAIIGIHGIFPGSKDLDAFWRHLEEGEDLITKVPSDRWDWKAHYSADPAAPNKSVSHSGGFIADADKFDAAFFHISPREAELMDPQQRLLLQSVWKSAEDAGQKASGLSGRNVGVFIGFQFNDYQELLQERGEISPQLVVGNAHAILSNRISYYMNFKGPSESIDTACSSSLVAIHRAVQSIQSGESELAFAGGISLMLSPRTTVSASKLGILSHDNRCKTFDKSANGYVRGEGVGTLLLKPLDKAIADGDPIHAVIKGSAENHGGRAHSLTAPNPDAQAAVIVRACEKANISPDSVTYIEAHGTGTELGDPVEIEGLKKAFAELHALTGMPAAKRRYCGIGSVKTNIGHLEPAAGIAGVMKVILSLKHRTLPASIHCREVNPYIQLADTPFYIVDSTRRWEAAADGQGNPVPRRAGVSSFGFGGANAHIVLEEFPEREERDPEEAEGSEIIVLSAKDRERLADYARDLLTYLERAERSSLLPSGRRGGSLTLGNIAYTLQLGREAMEERLAVVVRNIHELKDYLLRYTEGRLLAEDKVFLHRVKETGREFELFRQDEDARDMLRRWAAKRKLDKIARLWVSGCEMEWEWLHDRTRKRKIPLPTYPFKKERHWVAGSPLSAGGRLSGELGPLLDSLALEQSLGEGVAFTKELNADLPELRDHIIQGRRIFPGTAYLEMAYRGASLMPGKEGLGIRLCRVVWMNPLIAEGGEPKVLLGYKQAESGLAFEIKDFGSGQLYAKGEVRTGPQTDNRRISVEEIKSRCSRQMEGGEIYSQYEANGVNYGPSFRGISKVYAAEGEAVAELRLSEAERSRFSDYTLHPGLLDSALQVIGCIKEAGAKVYVPFAVDEVEVLQPLKASMYAYVRALDGNSYHVSLLDDEGNVCLDFRRFTLRESKVPHTDLYYRLAWRSAPLPGTSGSAAEERAEPGEASVLILYAEGGQSVAECIGARYRQPMLLKLGTAGRKHADNHREIKADSAASLSKYVSRMEKLDTVYVLSGLHTGFAEAGDREALNDGQEKGVLSLFRLVQALDRKQLLRPGFRLKLLTSNVYPVAGAGTVLPTAAAMHGFLKSMAKEYPKLDITSVDLDLGELGESPGKEAVEEWLKPLWTEPPHPDGETVSYRQGERFERAIEPAELPKAKESAIRQNGVYMIAGGAGGIGLELSRYLSRKAGARLLLVGRSELDEAGRTKLDEMEALGGTVVYHRGDITSEASMKEAVEAAKLRFGDLHGVFHSAIVSADKTIANLSERDFRSALAPKTAGSQALYAALRHEKLDFMAFFSSTSSVVGMPGQSNYVSGLNFKDMFAHYIQAELPFPVKVFNWGFWGLGSSEGDDYGRRLRRQGIHAISAEEGMETIERVLSHPAGQWFILKADRPVLERIGAVKGMEPPQSSLPPEAESLSGSPGFSSAPQPSSEAERNPAVSAGRLEDSVKRLLAATLKMDPDRLGRDASFDELGIDSLLGLELHAKLEKSFGELPPALLFERRTLAGLSAFLAEHRRGKPEAVTIVQEEALEGGSDGRRGGAGPEEPEESEPEWVKGKPDFVLPVPVESFMVEIGPGTGMEVSVSGEGEPILIVPGFAVTFLIHAQQIKAWSKSHKVISINLPGHGRSGVTEDLTCAGIARTMMRVMDKLEITQPMHVVGGSFGGMIAQCMAEAFPERVRSLSLMASFTLSKFEGVAQYFSFVEAVARDFEGVRAAATAQSRLGHIEDGFQLYKMSQVTNGQLMLKYLEMMKAGMTTRGLLQHIRTPALVIGGAIDSVVDPEESKLLHAGIEHSKYLQIKDGGHFVNLTHPHRINRAVMNFILQQTGEPVRETVKGGVPG